MLSNTEFLYPGIYVYRNVFPKELEIAQRLEKYLTLNEEKKEWNVGNTGYNYVNKDYRDCWDFKIKEQEDGSLMLSNGYAVDVEDIGPTEAGLRDIWRDCKNAQIEAVEDYKKMFNLAPLGYWEAFNFIKYGPGQHFQTHSDHGYSYICVLSSVGYVNDDYEGGELYFDKIGVKIKPKAGDLYLFPSSYIYSHAAMPVTSGVKYSVVTMLDYLEAAHTPDYFDIEERYKIVKD